MINPALIKIGAAAIFIGLGLVVEAVLKRKPANETADRPDPNRARGDTHIHNYNGTASDKAADKKAAEEKAAEEKAAEEKAAEEKEGSK